MLHPTALPGDHGKLGETAREFVDFLAGCGMTVWQTLPIGPTHPDLSPYQSLSAHAGNPAFIDLAELVTDGLLATEELASDTRENLMARAYQRFLEKPADEPGMRLHLPDFHRFNEQHRNWLDDFALFMAIRALYPGQNWTEWPSPLRHRDPEALEDFRQANALAIDQIRFEQFVFHHQWAEIRRYARDRGIFLFGDIPIFVAHDSADVWANPELFKLDAWGLPSVVAGVPPDYFSPEGQHWGNPLYDWQKLAATGYRWWLERLASQREKFDLLRIDHFRGLQAFWEIPAADPRPVNGYWVPGPADEFLAACFRELPDLPLVAENLGIIGDDVEQLRHRFRLPGMTVMQFGFDGSPHNPHLLHNHRPEDVVYTGTHDNDTTAGWYQSLDARTRAHVNRYLRIPGGDAGACVWQVIQAALGSVSRLVMVPMQDLLQLGSEARFNTPGTTENNWIWTLPSDYQRAAANLGTRDLLALYGR